MRIAQVVFTFFISFATTANAGMGGGPACNCAPEEENGGVWCTTVPLEDIDEGNNKGCECYNSGSGGSFVDYCSYQGCCTGIFRSGVPQWKPDEDPGRRLLGETHVPHEIFREGDEAKYQETVNQCGHYQYETALFVDKHLYAIASPTKDAEAANCPYVIIHSNFGSGVERPKKEAMVFPKKQDGEAKINGETHPIGTFKLSTLVEAYETAEPGLDSGFDILSNNCATFMVNLASHLGVKVDAHVTSYVANRLLQEAGSDLLNKIKSSVNFPRRNLRADMADQELVNTVVEQQAANVMV